VFYIFHGENEFDRDEAVAELRHKLATGDSAMVELNTSVFDASRLTLGELRHACDAIPFMADCRLVIVRGLLTRLASGRKVKSRTAQVTRTRPGSAPFAISWLLTCRPCRQLRSSSLSSPRIWRHLIRS